MTWLARLFRRARLDAQLDAELRDHLERLAADYVRAGAGVPDARPCRRSDARPCAIAGPWPLAP
jgi:hypothetical protein